MERFRIEVGHEHEVQPREIVGAIANEAGLDGEYIGHIDIREKFSLIELPEGMPKAVFNDLKKVWIGGQKLKISRVRVGEDRRASPNKIIADSGDLSSPQKKRKKPLTEVKKKKRKTKKSAQKK